MAVHNIVYEIIAPCGMLRFIYLALCPIRKKPAAQTAHLVFLQTRKPTQKKPKELFFANALTE